MATTNKSQIKEMSCLDPLQSGGGLCDTLWHIKALGGTDFGIDQPLLEVSQGRPEPLLHQAFLILTLLGCSQAETGGEERCEGGQTKQEMKGLYAQIG